MTTGLEVRNAARDLSSAWQAFESHVLLDCSGRCKIGLLAIVRRVKGERTSRRGGVAVRQVEADSPPGEATARGLWMGAGAAARVEAIQPIVQAALAGQGCEEAAELARELEAADAAHSLTYEAHQLDRSKKPKEVRGEGPLTLDDLFDLEE